MSNYEITFLVSVLVFGLGVFTMWVNRDDTLANGIGDLAILITLTSMIVFAATCIAAFLSWLSA